MSTIFKTKELKSFYNMFCNELQMNAFWDNEFLEKISKLLHEKHFENDFHHKLMQTHSHLC